MPVRMSPVQVSSDGKEVCLAQHPGNFYGGKIKDFLSFWRQFSSDPFFEKFLMGDFLEFIEFPSCPCPPPNLRLSQSDQLALDRTIQNLLIEQDVYDSTTTLFRYKLVETHALPNSASISP